MEVGPSDPFRLFNATIIVGLSGVDCGHRFEEKQMNLVLRHRTVLDAPGDNAELPFAELDVAVTEADRERALHHEKEFILPVMAVPDELTLELRELDVLSVQLSDDLRRPLVGEEGELFGEVDLVDLHGISELFSQVDINRIGIELFEAVRPVEPCGIVPVRFGRCENLTEPSLGGTHEEVIEDCGGDAMAATVRSR